jgi:hypothetical protein
MERQRQGQIRRLVPYIVQMLDYNAKNYVNSQMSKAARYKYLEDVTIGNVLRRPRGREKAKLILAMIDHPDHQYDGEELVAVVREAVQELVSVRFANGHPLLPKKASKWLSVLLTGKRPLFDTNSLMRFNGSRYETAKHIYSIALQRLRELILSKLGEVSE